MLDNCDDAKGSPSVGLPHSPLFSGSGGHFEGFHPPFSFQCFGVCYANESDV